MTILAFVSSIRNGTTSSHKVPHLFADVFFKSFHLNESSIDHLFRAAGQTELQTTNHLCLVDRSSFCCADNPPDQSHFNKNVRKQANVSKLQREEQEEQQNT